MTESGPPESGTPLPPVNADDLKRVWGLIRNMVVDHGVSGIDERMISRQYEAGADVNAVFFRGALLLYLFQSGVLDDWCEGNEPADPVFRVGAVFPMELGVQGFDPAGFMERLRSAES